MVIAVFYVACLILGTSNHLIVVEAAFATCTKERCRPLFVHKSSSSANSDGLQLKAAAAAGSQDRPPDEFLMNDMNNYLLEHKHVLPIARILNSSAEEDSHGELVRALQNVGFGIVLSKDASRSSTTTSTTHEYDYIFSRATGMLKYVSDNNIGTTAADDAIATTSGIISNPPKWVPLLSGQENVLVKNGWSFLDADNTEPMSAFDTDAANKAGTYSPKWNNNRKNLANDDNLNLSSLGYALSINNNGNNDLVQLRAKLAELTRSVLFEGKTDPKNKKQTHNGYSFAGSVEQSVIPKGIFCTALGDLPLFATCDLAPTTASSGWLSFVRPISEDHVLLIVNNDDDREEVICARTRLHLGHYFGRGHGYCINASALNFYPLLSDDGDDDDNEHGSYYDFPVGARPISWIKLLCAASTRTSANTNITIDPTIKLLHDTLINNYIINKTNKVEHVALGAGCFWHVEFALRRLPGIISTQVGFAGGELPQPTYNQVCNHKTGHAEVVVAQFDPCICPRRVLMDCFLAMHDPIISRAHGNRYKGSGQYRSCIFTTSNIMTKAALEAMDECKEQLLLKDNNTSAVLLSTEVIQIDDETTTWFWRAEDKHQLHDERVKKGKVDTTTLSFSTWLKYYGKRHDTIW